MYKNVTIEFGLCTNNPERWLPDAVANNNPKELGK